MLKQQEKHLVKACMQYLTLRGFVPIRTNSGALVLQNGNGKTRVVKMGQKGTPDIIACSPDGRFVAIECKVRGNKPTPAQKEFLNRLARNRAHVIVAYSIDDLIKAGL
jgi:Holliday junction resolvase